MGKLLIPFDKDGNQLNYAYPHRHDPNIIWKENYVFHDTLVYWGYSKGRSSLALNFRSDFNGKEYTMFMSVFNEMILREQFGFGQTVEMDFTFKKRGQNFSVCPVEDE